MRPNPSRKGFTLVEIMLVVAIIGIISMVGYGSLAALLPRYRTRSAAMAFASSVDQLRTMAIVNNREYRIYLDSADDNAYTFDGNSVGIYWLQAGNEASKSTIWDTLPIDDGGADARMGEGYVDISMGAEDAIPFVSIVPWATLEGPSHGTGSASNSNCIVFSPRGWVMNPNDDFSRYTHGYIHVEFINKKGLAEGRTEIYTVRISRSGFARVDYSPTPIYDEVSGNPIGIDGTSSPAMGHASGGGS